MFQTKTVGATGNIEFDERGKRINYVLYVNEIYLSNRLTVGRWESSNGTAITETSQNRNGTINQKNKKFRVSNSSSSFLIIINQHDTQCTIHIIILSILLI